MGPVWRAIARLVRALSRRSGRGGGTTLPGRLLLRADPAALERMAERLDSGAVLVSATNGKTTTSAMVAADPGARGPARGAQPRGLEHGLGRGHRAARRRAASRARSASSRWTRRGCRASRRRCIPRTYLLSNLFRDQLDRYGELESLADGWAELVAADDGPARGSCSTPTTR